MTTNHPTIAADEIGWLSEAEMIEVDRVMVEDLHVELIQMMENAGRNLAQLVIDLYAPDRVAVLSGSGGNGGGGLVAARHLANRGVDVSVTLAQPVDGLTPIPAHQFDIIERMGVAITDRPTRADVVIDALVGYSLDGAPRGRLAELIDEAPALGEHIVSLDAPSGLNVTDGSMPGAVIEASATLTLALPKLGLRAAPQVGDLFLADISVPPSVYGAMNAGPAPEFGASSILRISIPGRAPTH